MDYGLVFVVFIAAMAAAHLVVRNWRRLPGRMNGQVRKAESAGTAGYKGWYCFFRPRIFRGGPAPKAPVRPPRVKTRPRPRAT